MALDPYALTLWTFVQSEEFERLSGLARGREYMRLADMIAVGFHEPKKLSRFDLEWKAEVMASVTHRETREEMARRADDLWSQHETALRSRPVS